MRAAASTIKASESLAGSLDVLVGGQCWLTSDFSKADGFIVVDTANEAAACSPGLPDAQTDRYFGDGSDLETVASDSGVLKVDGEERYVCRPVDCAGAAAQAFGQLRHVYAGTGAQDRSSDAVQHVSSTRLHGGRTAQGDVADPTPMEGGCGADQYFDGFKCSQKSNVTCEVTEYVDEGDDLTDRRCVSKGCVQYTDPLTTTKASNGMLKIQGCTVETCGTVLLYAPTRIAVMNEPGSAARTSEWHAAPRQIRVL